MTPPAGSALDRVAGAPRAAFSFLIAPDGQTKDHQNTDEWFDDCFKRHWRNVVPDYDREYVSARLRQALLDKRVIIHSNDNILNNGKIERVKWVLKPQPSGWIKAVGMPFALSLGAGGSAGCPFTSYKTPISRVPVGSRGPNLDLR